jgi:hypothetical protein
MGKMELEMPLIMLFRGLIQWCKCGALYKKKIRKILYVSFLRIF